MRTVSNDAKTRAAAYMATEIRRNELLRTEDAAARLGINSEQFFRLANRMNVKAESRYTHSHGGSNQAYLWAPEDVERMRGSNELAEAKTRSAKRKEAKERKAQGPHAHNP